jgi:hypothetical protein
MSAESTGKWLAVSRRSYARWGVGAGRKWLFEEKDPFGQALIVCFGRFDDTNSLITVLIMIGRDLR